MSVVKNPSGTVTEHLKNNNERIIVIVNNQPDAVTPELTIAKDWEVVTGNINNEIIETENISNEK